jgi:hypothetical protein
VGQKKLAPLHGAGGAKHFQPARGRVNENYAGFCVRIIVFPFALLPEAKYQSP